MTVYCIQAGFDYPCDTEARRDQAGFCLEEDKTKVSAGLL
jgi:hypothetical protein